MAELDLIVDDNGLRIYNGDLVFADASKQHQKHLLLTAKGGAKNHPSVGVGLQNYLNDDLKPYELEGAISVEFEKDGMKVDRVKIINAEESEIVASYEN